MVIQLIYKVKPPVDPINSRGRRSNEPVKPMFFISVRELKDTSKEIEGIKVKGDAKIYQPHIITKNSLKEYDPELRSDSDLLVVGYAQDGEVINKLTKVNEVGLEARFRDGLCSFFTIANQRASSVC